MENKVKNLLNPYLYQDIISITQGGTDFACFENKTILITGAGQSVGYYIACALLIYNDLNNSNIKVIAVDRNNNLMDKYAELTSREDIDFVISESYDNFGSYKADFVIHNENSFSNPNVSITNLLKYVQDNKVTSTVINSDIMIYGTVYNGKAEIFENDLGYVDLANPKTNVVQSMRMAECVAINFAKTANVNIKITRSAIVYGITSDKTDPLYHLFSSDNQETVAMFTGATTGTTTNGYCYVTDCAKGILTALLKGKSGEIYNISSPDSVASNNELSEIIAKNMKTSGGMKMKKSTLSPMAPTQNVLNCNKIQELGFKANVDLELGYKRIATIVRNGN